MSIGIDFGIGNDQNSWYRTGIVSKPKKLVSPIASILTPPTQVHNTPFYAKSAGHVTRPYQGISLPKSKYPGNEVAVEPTSTLCNASCNLSRKDFDHCKA